MMYGIKRILVIVLLCGVVFPALSQQEGTLYFMNSLPQVTYVNPALQPRYKFSLGLPGSSVYAQYANNAFNYKDFAKKQGDSVIGDLNKLYGALKKKNYLTQAVQADLFRISVKINARMYFTWNITAKSYTRQMLPQELFGILTNGTSPLVNKPTTFSPQVEGLAYVESGWGASYVVDRHLTVGLKVKLLKGIANATTAASAVNLSIDDNYNIKGVADVNLKTSGIHQFDNDDFDMGDDWEVYKKNTGMAFDLGATYSLMDDRLILGASVLDIGGITWKNDTYGYRLDPAKAHVTFEGVNLERVLNGEKDYYQEVSDSIDTNFEFEKGTIGSYRTPLPKRFYLSGSYMLKKTLNVGLLLYAEQFRGRFAPSMSASIHKEFGRRLSTSLSYTITNNSFNNIGAGISLNFAPLQLYVVGDNLLGAPIALASNSELNSYLNSAQFVNVRAGLNFVFGWDKKAEKIPNPKP